MRRSLKIFQPLAARLRDCCPCVARLDSAFPCPAVRPSPRRPRLSAPDRRAGAAVGAARRARLSRLAARRRLLGRGRARTRSRIRWSTGWCGGAIDAGLGAVIARAPRAAIDCNRAEDELDPLLIDGRRARRRARGRAPGSGSSRRGRVRHGDLWRGADRRSRARAAAGRSPSPLSCRARRAAGSCVAALRRCAAARLPFDAAASAAARRRS